MRSMLKIYHLLLLSLLSLVACSSEDPVTPELIVAKEQMIFGKNGATQMLAIKTNVPWTVTSSESWCTVSPVSGEAGTKKIDVVVAGNELTDQRTARITVTAGSLSKEVLVTQALKDLLVPAQTEYEVDAEGGTLIVDLQYTGEYRLVINGDWIVETPTPRAVSNESISFDIPINTGVSSRVGTLIFTTADLTVTVTVTQLSKEFNIPADMTGMESEAKDLIKKIHLGWNLGNTMEVPGNETGWGNPRTTKAMIDFIKASGFDAVRIPCAWDSYIEDSETFKIKSSWLARVKEVVDYCVDNDMYVVLNIHWDGGWLEENPTYAKQEAVNLKQDALWKQIALYFRDYDEHLMFAGTNEVHANYSTPTAENNEVQQSYNQTFVDAVRATGGRNAYRNLVVQTYNTNISYGVRFMNMPEDNVANRLVLEVHYYDPWDFCGDESAGGKYLWGKDYSGSNVSSWGQEDHMAREFASIKTTFVDRGIPAILGEYGVIRRSSLTGNALTQHLDARAYYYRLVTEIAKNNGIAPFYWDNGYHGNNGFAIINRNNNTVSDQQALDALVAGANAGRYPF